ncbi:hypothetical protein B0H12DRAFT_785564 [Mycena haematopus]|nr:hypothetical protein B0H12DRAFT_785564 [Mycena haematopus]
MIEARYPFTVPEGEESAGTDEGVFAWVAANDLLDALASLSSLVDENGRRPRPDVYRTVVTALRDEARACTRVRTRRSRAWTSQRIRGYPWRRASRLRLRLRIYILRTSLDTQRQTRTRETHDMYPRDHRRIASSASVSTYASWSSSIRRWPSHLKFPVVTWSSSASTVRIRKRIRKR